MPGRVDRGSSRRLEQLSPFAELGPLLLVVGVGLLALGFCVLLMFRAR